MAEEAGLKTDVVDENNDDVKKIVGVAQPLFIKIAAALILLIIIGIAAWFFLSAEQASTPENGEVIEEILTDGEETDTESVPDEDTTALNDIQTQLQQVEQQNTQLLEQLSRIEQKLITMEDKQQRINSQTILNQYSDDKAFPPVMTEPPQPRPEPSWGEFKRAK